MPIRYESMPYMNPADYPPMLVQNPWERQESWNKKLETAEVVKETTMLWIDGDTETEEVTRGLAGAAAQGARSVLHIDDINRINPTGGRMSLIPRNPFSRRVRDHHEKFKEMCEEIRGAGVILNVNNPARKWIEEAVVYGGRDHRKVGITKDRNGNVAGWLKDYNIGQGSFDMLCYALETQHPPTVAALERQIAYSRYIDKEGHYVDKRPTGDLIVDIPGQPYRLLMDRGDCGRSVLLKTALELTMIDGPAIHANQYPISGRMAQAIKERSKREQPTLVITSAENDPKNLRNLSGRRAAAIKWEKDTKDNPYIFTFYHYGRVHSKAFLVSRPEGVMGIVGTNNFNEVGIWLGTQENGLFIHIPSSLGNMLWYRHLADAHPAEGYPAPFDKTKHEEVFNALGFRNLPHLTWDQL